MGQVLGMEIMISSYTLLLQYRVNVPSTGVSLCRASLGPPLNLASLTASCISPLVLRLYPPNSLLQLSEEIGGNVSMAGSLLVIWSTSSRRFLLVV